MVESLRDRQKQLARETILQTAADLIVEDGLESLSLAEIAERAGVSKRTLYNYFDSRDTLLADLGRWSDELTIQMGGALAPEGLDTLPTVIQAVWKTWSDQGTVHKAASKIDAASIASGLSEGRQRRRSAMTAAVREVRPDLNAEVASELAAVFHAITSAPVFTRITAEDGLTVERAGELIAWVLTILRDNLAAGNGPDD